MCYLTPCLSELGKPKRLTPSSLRFLHAAHLRSPDGRSTLNISIILPLLFYECENTGIFVITILAIHPDHNSTLLYAASGFNFTVWR